jgi:diguanylate cyclase (GGDEF)-like protein
VSGHLERKVPITNFLLGSRLRMTGICRIVAGGPWRMPTSFHIEMRNAADVQLIARPSWWTIQHLLELLAALLTVAIAIAASAILLGRRVTQQAARIKRSMRVTRERSRILLSELALVAVRESLLHEKLVYHSTHDPLTGLPNRRLYESRLDSAIEKAEHQSGQLAVIYIDIDRFKVVNDKFGHKVGDVYLRLIAARFRAQLRSADTLARIGGDEFLVMTPHAEHFDPAEVLLRRLQSCFDEPFLIENECIEGSASFGLARYPEDGITAEELQRSADHAMYAVKRNAAAALAS